MPSLCVSRRFLSGAIFAGALCATAIADPIGFAGRSPGLSGPGIPPTRDSFFDVFVDIDLPPISGGILFGPASGTYTEISPNPHSVPLSGNLQGVETPLSSGGFDIEILSLTLTGTGILIRESPTLPSITHLPPGQHIPGFFDVFFEISLDGGNSWAPGSLRLSQVPDDASLGVLLTMSIGTLAFARRFECRSG